MTNHYTYRVEWSTDREEYVGRCDYLHRHERHSRQSLASRRRSTNTCVKYEVFGGEPPTPLTEHIYSGRFMIRTSRALHARLTMEAAERERVSLNQWVVRKPPSGNPTWIGRSRI